MYDDLFCEVSSSVTINTSFLYSLYVQGVWLGEVLVWTGRTWELLLSFFIFSFLMLKLWSRVKEYNDRFSFCLDVREIDVVHRPPSLCMRSVWMHLRVCQSVQAHNRASMQVHWLLWHWHGISATLLCINYAKRAQNGWHRIMKSGGESGYLTKTSQNCARKRNAVAKLEGEREGVHLPYFPWNLTCFHVSVYPNSAGLITCPNAFPPFKGKLAHTFFGNTSFQNYQISLFVGETIVYKEKNLQTIHLKGLICTMKRDDYIYVFISSAGLKDVK